MENRKKNKLGKGVEEILLSWGYTEEDRMKNIERITQKAQRLNFIDENTNIVVAAMTPFSKMRKLVKNKLSESVTFIFIKSDINICMERDPKNIYKNNNE